MAFSRFRMGSFCGVFGKLTRARKITSHEGGAADAERRPAGVREARFRRTARERMRRGPRVAPAPPARSGGARIRRFFAHDARAPEQDRF